MVGPIMQINLVSMPFAALTSPSIALTQLKGRLEQCFRGAVRVRICYLNLEFGRRLGLDAYNFVAHGAAAELSGFGEWLFSRLAFPSSPDNTLEYLEAHRACFGPGKDLPVVLRELLDSREHFTDILDELIADHELDRADVVGFTSMFQQTCPSIALATRLRARRSDQIIIMGGANCEGTMGIELAANVPALDFVFSGPGLVSCEKVVGHLLGGDMEACHQVMGVYSKRNSSAAACSSGTPRRDQASIQGAHSAADIGAELDINTPLELSYDDYLECQRGLLPGLRHVSLMFETSRGCWWGERAHCTFCGLNGQTMSYRAMHPDRALEVIQTLLARYVPRGVTSFQCVDNILPISYIDEVFPKLRPPEHVRIFYEVKADLSEQQLAVLGRAGVRRIQPGIEALATSTLKLMRKGTTAFQNVQLLMSCVKHGVVPIWNLLIGFPREDPQVYESYLSVLPRLYHLCPPTSVSPIRFDRFSPYFFRAKDYALDLQPFSYYSYCFPFPPAAIESIAYYFDDRNSDAPYRIQATRYLARLRELVSSWRTRFTGADGLEPARLQLQKVWDGVAWIEDTRTGNPRTIELSREEFRALVAVRVPQTERDMQSQFAPMVLDKLIAEGLVFSERGRYMSLALDCDLVSSSLPTDSRRGEPSLLTPLY